MPVLPAAGAAYNPHNGGLLFACWAIVIILGAMFIVFMRAHKREYALAVIPLILLPLVHIGSGPLARLLGSFFPLGLRELRHAVDVTGGLFACLLIGLTARRIQGRRTRLIFTACCTAFLIILTLVLVLG